MGSRVLQLPVRPTVRVMVISRPTGLHVGAGAPASPPPDPLPPVTFFQFFKHQNCLASKPAVPCHPLAVPCCPWSSCRKLHKGPFLRPALGPGQPVSQVRAGSPPRHAPPPIICLAVGSAPGLRAETQGQGGMAGPLWSGFPAPPARLVTCGFDYGSSLRPSREPSGQRFPGPSFWFQPWNPVPASQRGLSFVLANARLTRSFQQGRRGLRGLADAPPATGLQAGCSLGRRQPPGLALSSRSAASCC